MPPAAPVPHAAHDRLLVAALADRTTDALTRAELDAARAQVTTCPDCAALHADLVAIAAAVPTAAIPTRPRDFRIAPADAERLRAPAWRRWLAGVGSPRDMVTRPLAIGLTTLGLAGLLVATVGALPGSGGATSLEMLSTVGAPIGAPSAAPSAAPVAAAPEVAGAAASDAAAASAAPAAPEEPAATTTGDEQIFSGSDATDTAGDGSQRSSGSGAEPIGGSELATDGASSDTPTLLIAAGACLLVGLGLFGLRRTARRLGDG